MSKKDSFAHYDSQNPVFPASIVLGENFRSRSGVTQAVNYVFERLMTRQTGGLDYNEDERLRAAAAYEPVQCADTELWITRCEGMKVEDAAHAEARTIARFIKQTVESGATVGQGDKKRKADYGDFCILKQKRKRMKVYCDELTALGIPAHAPSDTPFFSTTEVSFILSLLRVIDNPTADIPLACVLMFPVFGFTADSLALMRGLSKTRPLYTGLEGLAEQGDAACADFIKRLVRYRNIAQCSDLVQLLFYIADDTQLYAVITAMGMSNARTENIRRLMELAQGYSDTAEGSVGGFLRYIARLEREGGEDFGSRDESRESGSVAIMTMHSSKGLEFPFVILAGCTDVFKVENDSLILSRSAGPGMKLRDAQKATRYKTLPYIAAAISLKQNERSEGLRLLYVAMTRARERLIISVTPKKEQALYSYAAAAHSVNGKVYPMAVCAGSSFAQWLVCAFFTHADCRELSKEYLCRNDTPAQFALRVQAGEAPPEQQYVQAQQQRARARLDLTACIAARIGYIDPYAAVNELRAKRAASSLAHESAAQYSPREPSFVRGVLTGAQRGTAVHRFMELCDYKAAARDAAAELERLVVNGALTQAEAEAVAPQMIRAFFESPPGKRLLKSQKVLREYSFSVLRDAAQLYEELPDEYAGEQIVLEGIADCIFFEDGEAVVVDFKTDRASNAHELVEQYRPQLAAYRSAVEECESVKVKECILYAFTPGDWDSF